jgi:S1-C subfamily serine protease
LLPVIIVLVVMRKQNESRPFVGIRLDLAAEECKVTKVREGSSAAIAGVQVGDVVLKFNDQQPSGPKELLSWLHQMTPGEAIALEVQRGQEVLVLDLVVGKRN